MATNQNDEAVGTTTIVDVFDELISQSRAFNMELPEKVGTSEQATQRREFKIRLADTMGRRHSAGMLIEKMYSWRGYDAPVIGSAQLNRITLVASNSEQTIGTVTIGFDSSVGLLIDDLYKEEVDELRRAGRRLCEFTKLAIDKNIRSKRVLAALFHIAFIYARHIQQHTDLFIEVNPRHVTFYERMLGFRQLGEQKLNPRVKAPAILLGLDFDHVERQIFEFGGKGLAAVGEKSLYPFGFSPGEVEGIVGRLAALQ